ncbi:MAG TPA: division/cell wall cluster transcriptional repressor MraZ [Bacteroidetes bacterium]|nr:division/cell wall cluster transcriptional repressor MraZ [Bacteroidota bacterium]
MYQLLGEYPCKIDAKGRLRLPSGLIDQLPSDERDLFVINRGFEGCLNLYPKKVWDEKTVQINKLNEFDLNSRRFKRAFLNGASHLKKDGADRVNLPNGLLEFAGIKGEAVLAAVNDRVEIWSKEQWKSQMEIDPAEFAKLAQATLGNAGKEGSETAPPMT